MRWTFACFLLFGLGVPGVISQNEQSQDSMFQRVQQMHASRIWSDALEMAKIYLESSPQRDSNIILAHQIIGDCLLEMADFDGARQQYQRARAMSSDHAILLGNAHQKLGNYFLTVKEYQSAIIHLDTALALRLATWGHQHEKVSDVLNNLGIAYLHIGDFALAQEYHQEALSLRRNLPSVNRTKYAQSLNNLALCYQDMGKLRPALEMLMQARQIYTEQGDDLRLADVYLNLGNVYSDSLSWQEAIKMYRKALPLFQSDTLARALCINNLGNVLKQMGRFEEARHHYRQALALSMPRYGLQHPDVAETYFNLGMNEMAQGSLASALLYFDSCGLALAYDPDTDPHFLQVHDHRVLLFMLYRRAELQQMMFEKHQDFIWPRRAADTYAQIDLLFDYLRSMYDSSQSKKELLAINHHIYDEALQLLFTLYEITSEEQYLHTAFKYVEKSKGILLLEALQRSKANAFLPIPSTKMDSIKALEMEIGQFETERFLVSVAAGGNQRPKLDSLSHEILFSRRALAQQIFDLAEEFPAYHQLRYETVPPTIAYIQRHLIKNDQSLISYFLGGQFLWIFVVNESDFQVKRIGIDDTFSEVVLLLYEAILDYHRVPTEHIRTNVESYISAANSLHTALISPLGHILKRDLIIIPDGLLGFVPFEALLTTRVDSIEHFRDYPYLIKNHAISYNYSVRAFQEMKERAHSQRLKSYLGFAPEFYEQSSVGLLPLVHNVGEVNAAQETLGGDVLINRAATRKAFVEQLDKYQIVHLATHALANSTQDDYSYIAFSHPNKDSIEPSLLYVREIYSLTSRADLVVLSACETATGRLYEGEGIISVARSFSFAGAKSLLATRWNINDKTTKVLVGHVFDNLKQGYGKDQALQRASLSFMERSSHYYAHPFFWASFMTIGNMDAIELQNGWWPQALGAFFLVMLLCYILVRRFRTKHWFST